MFMQKKLDFSWTEVYMYVTRADKAHDLVMQHILLSQTSLESGHLIAINNVFYHSMRLLHCDNNILQNVSQTWIQYSGARQLYMGRVVLPILMNVCPALY